MTGKKHRPHPLLGKRRKVAVLMGGWSAEREVSLVSGAAVARALEDRGYDVQVVDVQRDLEGLMAALSHDQRPDVAFNALHGRGGEDGTIQGVLDFLGIPHTHSGVMASAIAMDKPMTKRLLETVGVRSPKGLVVAKGALGSAHHEHPMDPPYVIKPVDEGSTVGVTLVRAGQNAPVGDAWTFGSRALVEEFIKGRELTVGVMDGRALAVTEIRFKADLFDYTAKYSAGHATHVIPAEVPEEIAAEAKRVALLAHETLGCAGVSRTDFRWDDTMPGTEGLYFLEINTQPGMTPLSLVPEQAAHVGMSYGELVAWLVEHASCANL